MKGYVVRGTDDSAPAGREMREERVGSLPAAIDVYDDMREQGHDAVRIYAVAEDGAETPLPTYEEALAQLAERDAERKAWARYVTAVEVRWREDFQGAAQIDYMRGMDDASAALRAFGIDVDALA